MVSSRRRTIQLTRRLLIESAYQSFPEWGTWTQLSESLCPFLPWIPAFLNVRCCPFSDAVTMRSFVRSLNTCGVFQLPQQTEDGRRLSVHSSKNRTEQVQDRNSLLGMRRTGKDVALLFSSSRMSRPCPLLGLLSTQSEAEAGQPRSRPPGGEKRSSTAALQARSSTCTHKCCSVLHRH